MSVTSLRQVCEYRVSEAVSRHDLEQYRIRREELIERVAGIVSRNLASGRAQRVMPPGEGAMEQGSAGAGEGVARVLRAVQVEMAEAGCVPYQWAPFITIGLP